MKKYSEKIKQQARSLREKGLSYKEIGDTIGVAKSTAKLWCEGIKLPPAYHKRLYSKRISNLSKGFNGSHERRKREIDDIIKKAENEIKRPLNYESYKLVGAALYWGEGDKTQQFSVTNSDPLLIKFMVCWINNVLNVPSVDIKAYLNIYSQQNESDIKIFWSNVTGIPLKNFGKSFIKPISNKSYRKNKLYNGTIKIIIPKGSNTRHRIYGWLVGMLKDLDIADKKLMNIWHRTNKRP